MLYRLFRAKDGQWLDLVMTTTGEGFPVPEKSHIEAAAKACELDPRDVECVEADSDIRKGDRIQQRPPKVEVALTTREKIVADLEEASTIAGLRRALLDYYGGEDEGR